MTERAFLYFKCLKHALNELIYSNFYELSLKKKIFNAFGDFPKSVKPTIYITLGTHRGNGTYPEEVFFVVCNFEKWINCMELMLMLMYLIERKPFDGSVPAGV